MNITIGDDVTRTHNESIPTGDVRVVFQGDNENPTKSSDQVPDSFIWHWDNNNITIESS